MLWKRKLSELSVKYPQYIVLSKRVDLKQLNHFHELFGRSIESLDFTWKEVLEYSNGIRMADYWFYPIFAETIQTTTFKTVYLWQYNIFWQERLFLFMGDSKLFEFGLLPSYLGQPCIGAIWGFDAKEAIPLASSMERFLTNFFRQIDIALNAGVTEVFAPHEVEPWPSQLEHWYEQDTTLAQRLYAAGFSLLRQENPKYAELIWQSSRRVVESI